jgi:hypothetical protein
MLLEDERDKSPAAVEEEGVRQQVGSVLTLSVSFTTSSRLQCARIGRCAAVWAAAIIHGSVPSIPLEIQFLLRMLFMPHSVSNFTQLCSMCRSNCNVTAGPSDVQASVALSASWHAVALACCTLHASSSVLILIPQCARIPHQPSERLLLALHQRAAGAIMHRLFAPSLP